MKHADCRGEIVIHTDPKNTAYVVISGARKRDTGHEEEHTPGKRDLQSGEHIILTEKDRDELRVNAFANLEKTIADREMLVQSRHRIDELAKVSAKHWEDPYEKNSKLRKAFRVERKKLERDTLIADGIKSRIGFQLDLMPETKEDARRAALVDFGPDTADAAGLALKKPLFEKKQQPLPKRTKSARPVPKSEAVVRNRREMFKSEVVRNTRAGKDPFLNADRLFGPVRTSPSQSFGTKRKRADDQLREGKALVGETPVLCTGLVDYDSE